MAYFLIALLAGLAGVLQNGLNRKITDEIGLGRAIHISNAVVMIAGLLALTAIVYTVRGDFAELLKFKAGGRAWQWWYLVPGLCGILFVVSVPFTILKIGALKVFVAIVVAQIVGSLLWDAYVENLPLDIWRVTGSLAAVTGAVLVSFSKS